MRVRPFYIRVDERFGAKTMNFSWLGCLVGVSCRIGAFGTPATPSTRAVGPGCCLSLMFFGFETSQISQIGAEEFFIPRSSSFLGWLSILEVKWGSMPRSTGSMRECTLQKMCLGGMDSLRCPASNSCKYDMAHGQVF